jgi:stearoyl-CoA desaturase (delta-9 desaturase)
MPHPPAISSAPSAPLAAPASGGSWLVRTLRRWFDTSAAVVVDETREDRIDWLRAAPFIAMHLACLGVIWVGISPIALLAAAVLYAVRMFAITGFYHRYFSHRTFQTSRVVQFVFAAIGASCVQRGPLWWAAHHRHHHRHADTPGDPHSPRVFGFLWSHVGWFLTPRNFRTDLARVPDLAKYPELRWLDRFDIAVPVLLAVAMYGLGVLFHATVTINSLAHRFGKRRYETKDDSRNNLWLALLTFGEGWHNNHHFFPGSSRQGFRWYEVDLTWYGLKLMSMLGLVRGLKPVPAWVLAKARS